jgi:choline dehydrogenase
VISGRRINTGIAFLGDDVRTRPNLTITPHAEVDSVLFDGSRAVGVADAAGTTYRARQVILSAGAYGSPAILMRSGIGPAAHLRDLAILVRRPASRCEPAGTSLLLQRLRPQARGGQHASGGWRHPVGCVVGSRARRPRPARVRHPSVRPGAEPHRRAIVLAVAVTQPESAGRVRLADRDPRRAPIIQYNLLGTPRDMQRMIEGVHISRRIGRDAAFRAVAETEMLPGPAVTDDAALLQAIVEQLDVYHHATSTVAMSRDGDGVVDELGRVYGTEALMVADASIMPLAPSAPPNLTTMMIAEHVARRAFAPADARTAVRPTER